MRPLINLSTPKRLGARVDLYDDELLQGAISRWAWQHFGVSRAALLETFGLAGLGDGAISRLEMTMWPAIAKNIAYSTGIAEERLHAATQDVVRGVAVDFRERGFVRPEIWSRKAGTRYCPECIAERPGFINLYWRLPWIFACLLHHRLLRDTCAQCQGELVEMRGKNADVFDPSTCRADLARGNGTRRIYCRAPLADCAGEPRLHSASKLLAAQAAIMRDIRAGDAWPILSELQSGAIGLRGARLFDTIAELSGVDQSELRGLFDDEKHVGISPPKDALAMGALTTAAWSLRCLADDEAALRIIRRATFDRQPAPVPRGAGFGPGSPGELLSRWGEPNGPFRARILRALDADLTVSQRILWKTAAVGIALQTPSQPRSPQRRSLSDCVPDELWPAWCSRLDIGGNVRADALAGALATALRQVGAEDNRHAVRNLSDVLRPNMLGNQRQTTLIIRTLCQLALAAKASPAGIHYKYRSQIAAEALLPARAWPAVFGDDPKAPDFVRGLRNAQRYLWQRLTGGALSDLPLGIAMGASRDDTYGYSIFRIRMTLARQGAIDAYGAALLRKAGLTEPLVWSPDPLEALNWPGPEIDDLDIARLHEMLLEGITSRKRLAHELQISERRVMRAIDAFPPSDGTTAAAIDWDVELRSWKAPPLPLQYTSTIPRRRGRTLT